ILKFKIFKSSAARQLTRAAQQFQRDDGLPVEREAASSFLGSKKGPKYAGAMTLQISFQHKHTIWQQFCIPSIPITSPKITGHGDKRVVPETLPRLYQHAKCSVDVYLSRPYQIFHNIWGPSHVGRLVICQCGLSGYVDPCWHGTIAQLKDVLG
uniref:SWIM-type domain-containing protein n=1 Tax=Romanomermis culicivorax TaxID=13658 RepID=A0A915KPP6_ROMCU